MRTPDKLVTLGQTGTVSPHPGRCAFQNPGRLRKALWSHDIGELNRYKAVVVMTAAAHLAFIVYVVVGGFLGLRWRRSFWLHVPAGLWGMTTITLRLPCPLTELEGWARTKAGMPALPPEGFIGRYIRGVICPASWMGAAEVMVVVMIILSWALRAWRDLRSPCALRSHIAFWERADTEATGMVY
jgi:Protein of Unknown function (DUF2784)